MEYFTDFIFLGKKKFVTKERRRLDVHGGFLMDGWMEERKTSI